MTRFQGLPVGKLEHHDSYCCCSWDWLGEKVIHVAKSISPSRSWDDVAAQWVPVDLPLQGLLHASEKAWHRNYAHSSSSVGNALRFQSWAQCVWMLLTFHNWSRIYHCRDGRTFFEVSSGNRLQHFAGCKVQQHRFRCHILCDAVTVGSKYARVVRVEHQVNVQHWTGLGELHS